MLALLQTAERTSDRSLINNYIFQRHLFAYQQATGYLGSLVMELGCGNGYGMQLLSPRCNWYAGVDKKIPAQLKMTANSALFKNRLPNLKNIGDESFDTIVCFQVIEHIREDQLLLREIHRILKPGGRLLLTTPNRLMSLTRNPYHIREYTPQSMQATIGSVFEKFEVKGVFGNKLVMAYYEENKRNTERINRLDVLNLQHRLPAFLLRVPYNIANNLNRFFLTTGRAGRASTRMNSTDFFSAEVADHCLDFFVVAKK